VSPRGLSAAEVAASSRWLANCQLGNGMVPWYPGGHADPWNHVEVAMGLAAGGRWAEVGRAFHWLAATQLPDGSWCRFYLPDGVEDARRDPNACAYVATSAWWCHLLGAQVAAYWPLVEAALGWSVRFQRPGGEFAWSVSPDGVPGRFALLAASSSLQHSLSSGAQLASTLGLDRPAWQAAAERARAAVCGRPGLFSPKHRWAMDWYYPVLTGALGPAAGRQRLLGRWPEFVMEGLGVRCVADRDWVTAAETAECAMAANRAGLRAEAEALLAWTAHLRDPSDGAYWTGCAHPQCVRFPGGQKSTYSTAAVLIADHVIYGRSPAAAVFGPSASAGLLVDQVDQACQLVGVGRGQDPVAQVEHVPPFPSEGEHVARLGGEDGPGGQAGGGVEVAL